MGLYDRDYARSSFGYESVRRSESQTVAFVKETYKLFAASMLAGAVGAYVGIPFAASVAANYWLIAIPWMLFGMFGLNLAKNKPGINMIVLFAFTFVSGIIITPLLSHVIGLKGGMGIVANAFLMTSVLFGALSFFAIKTSKDFTTYAKPLIIAFFVILAFSLINVFFIHSPAIFLIVQAAFLLVISVMVIFDTQNIIKGAYETPMDGAIALYLDFFNLFVTLLQLFGIFGSNDD
jgi:modulator of FtsH protease